MNAPKVTPADIEAEIVSEHYFTASDGAYMGGNPAECSTPMPPAVLDRLTFCVLVLRNGFTVVGKSACVSPENFDAEVGKRIAREDAIEQMWPLLGFRLADSLARTPVDP